MRELHVLVVSCGLLMALVSESQSAEPESLGTFVIKIHAEQTAPFVEYCIKKDPSLDESLSAAHKIYLANLREVASELDAQIKASPELVKPASDEVVSEVSTTVATALALVKLQDPKEYCPQLRRNLSGATKDILRAGLRSTLSYYESSASKNKKSPP